MLDYAEQISSYALLIVFVCIAVAAILEEKQKKPAKVERERERERELQEEFERLKREEQAYLAKLTSYEREEYEQAKREEIRKQQLEPVRELARQNAIKLVNNHNKKHLANPYLSSREIK